MSQVPFQRVLDPPLMIRSRRDIALPWLWWITTAATLAAVATLIAGFAAMACGALLLLLLSLAITLVIQRRPPATMWLGREQLRSNELCGRIEIDSDGEEWRVIARQNGLVVVEKDCEARRRGGTAIIALDIPIAASAGDRLSLELRSSVGTAARFSLVFTARR